MNIALIKTKQKQNSIVKNFLYVVFSNGISFFLSLVTGFILPKSLGVAEYGHYVRFGFYSGYSTFFHYGFNDGISIHYGAYDYDKLPRAKFRMYFRFLLYVQVISVISIFLISFLLVGEKSSILINVLICFNILILNLSSYLGQVNDITRQFRFNSVTAIVTRASFVALALSFIMFGIRLHTAFIVLLFAINILELVVRIYYARDIIFGPSEKVKGNSKDLLQLLKNGFFQMIGNFIIVLLLGTGRFVLDSSFSVKEFGLYSFAVSIVNMVSLVLAAISKVVYPYLARTREEGYGLLFERMQIFVINICFILLTASFAVKFFIIVFMPEYKGSIIVMQFLFSASVFNAQIGIVCNNFFKVLRKQKEFIINNAIALFINAVFVLGAFVVFKDIEAIAFAACLTNFFWLLLNNAFFHKLLGNRYKKQTIYQVCVSMCFFASSYFLDWYLGLILYPCALLCLMLLFFNSDIKLLLRKRVDYFKIS